jgi:hypothetical protein
MSSTKLQWTVDLETGDLKPLIKSSSSASTGDNTIEDLVCDASVSVGNMVRMNGTTVVNAQADSFVNSKVFGVCVAKTNATTCNVQVTGFTDDIFVGLSTNELYFLSDSTPGAITTSPPTASGAVVQQVGRPVSSTSLVINITDGMVRA